MGNIVKTDLDLDQNQLKNARLENSSTTPSSPLTGQIIFNTVINSLLIYNGSIWISLDGTFGTLQQVLTQGNNTGGLSLEIGNPGALKFVGDKTININGDVSTGSGNFNVLFKAETGTVALLTDIPAPVGLQNLNSVLGQGNNTNGFTIKMDLGSLIEFNDIGTISLCADTSIFGNYVATLQHKTGTIALLSDISTPNLDTVVQVGGYVYSAPILFIEDNLLQISGDSGFTFLNLNSDNTSNQTQTFQNASGVIALLTDIIGISDITYIDLKSLQTGNNLKKGTTYHITDRDIWILALDTNLLSTICRRKMPIVKDEFYTPHNVSGGYYPPHYLGIYGQTYNQGSVPNSQTGIYGIQYYVIWGGKIWQRLTTGSDTKINDSTLGSGWVVVNSGNTGEYDQKIFTIEYNFDDDVIWTQSDDRGNVIKRASSSTSYIDITDWGNKQLENNKCKGIYNNFKYPNLPAEIKQNDIDGSIFNNKNNDFIFRNTNKGDISNNSNLGEITYNSNHSYINNNTNIGSIDSNFNTDRIINNSNGGNIINNSNAGYIQSNSNTGYIQSNSNLGVIYNNSNTSYITRNHNTGDISSNNSNVTFIADNSNAGYIQSNSNNGKIESNFNSGVIYYNQVNGDITRNHNTGDISSNNSNVTFIADNSNAGYIKSNSNKGQIASNSNAYYIYNNSNNGGIYFNSNRGMIYYNRSTGAGGTNIYNNSNIGDISYNNMNSPNPKEIIGNSNNGKIYNNSVGTHIEGNSNNGEISNNTSYNTMYNTFINNNSNNGWIMGNNGVSTFTRIQYNINNGNIGVASRTTDKSGTISDSIVNK